ncbi:MAG: hypothetical protein R2778_10140 [Saprospiraceae bacterium]
MKLFNEVAGKYTCFFVTQIIASLLKADGGRMYAKGKGVLKRPVTLPSMKG